MGHMSSSRQFAIMSLHADKIITKCLPFIYRILQYRQLTLERAHLYIIDLENDTTLIVVNHPYNYSCSQYRQFSLEMNAEFGKPSLKKTTQKSIKITTSLNICYLYVL